MTLEERVRRIREAFAEISATLVGIESTYDHEPEMVDKYPAVTMLYLGSQADDSEIGVNADVEHLFDVFVYVSVAHGGWRDGQYELPGLVASISLLSRSNKKLTGAAGASCDAWSIDDPREQPEFVVDEDGERASHIVKRLRLSAWSRDEL